MDLNYQHMKKTMTMLIVMMTTGEVEQQEPLYNRAAPQKAYTPRKAMKNSRTSKPAHGNAMRPGPGRGG